MKSYPTRIRLSIVIVLLLFLSLTSNLQAAKVSSMSPEEIAEKKKQEIYKQLDRGLDQQEQGKFAEALETFRKISEKNPETPYSYFHQGLLLAEIGAMKEALQKYRQAISKDDNIAEFHLQSGVVLMEMGKTESAIKHLNKAASIDPKIADAYNLLGVGLNLLGKTKQAEEWFHKAIELEKGYVEARINLGRLLIDEKRYPEAVGVLTDAVKQDPLASQAQRLLGYALLQTGKLEEARRSFQKAFESEESLPFEEEAFR